MNVNAEPFIPSSVVATPLAPIKPEVPSSILGEDVTNKRRDRRRRRCRGQGDGGGGANDEKRGHHEKEAGTCCQKGAGRGQRRRTNNRRGRGDGGHGPHSVAHDSSGGVEHHVGSGQVSLTADATANQNVQENNDVDSQPTHEQCDNAKHHHHQHVVRHQRELTEHQKRHQQKQRRRRQRRQKSGQKDDDVDIIHDDKTNNSQRMNENGNDNELNCEISLSHSGALHEESRKPPHHEVNTHNDDQKQKKILKNGRRRRNAQRHGDQKNNANNKHATNKKKEQLRQRRHNQNYHSKEGKAKEAADHDCICTDDDKLKVDDESSFPTLLATPNAPNAKNNVLDNSGGGGGGGGGDGTTSWAAGCLASKIEQQQEQELQKQQQWEEQLMYLEQERSTTETSVQLTLLSSSRSTMAANGSVNNNRSLLIDEDEKECAIVLEDGINPISAIVSQNIEWMGDEPTSFPEELIEGEEDVSENRENSTMPSHPTLTTIPNTRSKWSNSELSKMRQRWWEAVRSKQRQRRTADDNARDGTRFQEKDDDDLDAGLPVTSLSVSSSTSGESSSEDDIGNNIAFHEYHDPAQPPSLNTPFDEMAITPMEATISLFHEERIPQSVLDLEEECLRSTCPIHCAIYNYALAKYDNDGNCHHHVTLNDACISTHSAFGSSTTTVPDNDLTDAEIVLQRLLTMPNNDNGIDCVMRWKQKRVGLLELRGLEAGVGVGYQDRARSLTDSTLYTNLLSADLNSLTPLQLAVYWNLPRIILLLSKHATSTSSVPPSQTNKTMMGYPQKKYAQEEEEDGDDLGRTPLMLACELGHVASIHALLMSSAYSSPRSRKKMVDRRERVGGNNAYHLCCIGSSKHGRRLDDASAKAISNADCEDHHVDATAESSSRCADALRMLLRHTPPTSQKRVLTTTNHEGQNLIHIACRNADLTLLQYLLESIDEFGWKVSKALDAKDSRFGYTPFLAAVAADSTEVVMHLITTHYFGYRASSSSWLAGCPLVAAASNKSVKMVNLLLEVGYDASSSPFNLTSVGDSNGMLAREDEVNRALLETIYTMEQEIDNEDGTYEMISLLINHGGANPHQSASIRYPGEPRTRGDVSLSSSYPNGKMGQQEDTPILAAVRSGYYEAVRTMVSSYSTHLRNAKSARRNDPLLQTQPESYFRRLEEKEDDVVHSSVDVALAVSLFLLWQDGGHHCQNLSYDHGKCALVLYKQGRSNLSFSAAGATAVPQRNLSQRALQWLEKCMEMRMLLPPPKLNLGSSSEVTFAKNGDSDGFYFEAPIVQYGIVGERCVRAKVPYCDAGSNFMDWSHVLTELPWFHLRGTTGVHCNWLRQNCVSNSPDANNEAAKVIDDFHRSEVLSALAEDEFYLVVNGQKLLAHKSIVSARSGKLAAHIRFTESRLVRRQPLDSSFSSSSGEDTGHITVVDNYLSPLMAKMLLCHCYHGSIAFGLMKSLSPMRQCRQILEIALMAEEYLCPSLLLECELRLLVGRCSQCVCAHCSAGTILSKKQLDCPIGSQCLEQAGMNLKDNDNSSLSHCEPVGVYAYKTSSLDSLSSQGNSYGGLITPLSALDIIAVAQQLEQPVCPSSQHIHHQEGSYRIKICSSRAKGQHKSTLSSFGGSCWKIDANDKKLDKDISDCCEGPILAPTFMAAKNLSVRVMLRNFPQVLMSDSYCDQQVGDDNDIMAEADEPLIAKAVAGGDADDKRAILLLQTCLEELATSPLTEPLSRE